LWQRLGPDEAARLESEYPDSHATILAETSGAEDVCAHLLEAYRRLAGWLQQSGDGVGSNSWVLSGERTATGRPILANDPHLRLSLPSIWYENHLCVVGIGARHASPLHVTGITLPGVPGVILGHNERIAWGATATMADTQDLYLERLDPKDLNRYLTPQGWQQIDVSRESIRVRFRREPVEHVVRCTRHGPLITPPDAPVQLALKWTAYQPGQWLRAIFALNRAADWDSFKEALRGWHAPAVNMMYADVDGNIAYRVAGRIPVRRQGHGLMPAAGWTDDHEWIGEIPFDELPELAVRASHDSPLPSNHHILITANNRIAGPGYPHFISHEWLNGHRAARIRQRLDACERVSIEDSLSIQMDVQPLDAPELVERILQLAAPTEREAAALDHLRSWDNNLRAESVAASIYEVTQIELVRLLFEERLGPDFGGYVGDGQTPLFVNVIFSNIALRQVREVIGTRTNTDGHGSDEGVLRRAFQAALDKLTVRLGPDMVKWEWGRLHRIEPAHTLSQIGALRRLFNRGSFAIGGDGDTPHQANFRPRWPIEPVTVAPSHRAVVDVGDWDRSLAVLPGGQSGHPASPHYFDQFALWLAGRARPMPWSRAAVEREAAARLILNHAGAATH
jgi:penicillin amidase